MTFIDLIEWDRVNFKYLLMCKSKSSFDAGLESYCTVRIS